MNVKLIERLFYWFEKTNREIAASIPTNIKPNDIYNIKNDILAISNDITKEQPYFSQELLKLKDCLFNFNYINPFVFGQIFEILKELTNLSKVDKNKKKVIFISHRSTDKEVTEMLFDFLVAIGIQRDNIFCSSLPGNDVKESISPEVKEAVKNSCLNIAILSKEYYDSAYCLNEAGILWFQDITVIPIALPDIKPEDMIGFLNNDYKIRRLDNNNDIAYIYDTVREKFELAQIQTSFFTAEADKLKNKYSQHIDLT